MGTWREVLRSWRSARAEAAVKGLRGVVDVVVAPSVEEGGGGGGADVAESVPVVSTARPGEVVVKVRTGMAARCCCRAQ